MGGARVGPDTRLFPVLFVCVSHSSTGQTALDTTRRPGSGRPSEWTLYLLAHLYLSPLVLGTDSLSVFVCCRYAM